MTSLRIRIAYVLYAGFILLAVMPSVQSYSQQSYSQQSYSQQSYSQQSYSQQSYSQQSYSEQYVPENIILGMLHPASDLFQQWLKLTALPNYELNTAEDFSSVDIILINTTYPLTTKEQERLIQAYHQHKILIFDNALTAASTTASKEIADIIGLGLTDRFVIAQKPKNKPLQVHSLTFASNLSLEQKSKLLSKTLKHPIAQWSQQRSSRIRRQAIETDSKSHTHTPETTLSLQASWLGFPCSVSNEVRDACHGQASVSIFYTLDFIRSVPYPGGGNNNAKDEKYVRITVNPQSTSGAGWHLVDQPTQTYNSNGIFYSDTEWFGPFVMAYGVKIYPDNNQTHLLQHIPRNPNIKKQIREHTGITVGVDAGAKLGSGPEGIDAGVEAKGSFSYTSNRWVIYDTYEYDLINKSSGDTAEWSWDRQYDINHRHWLYNPSNVWGPADASILFDKSQFSPAAYANFTPGFSAIYSTDGQQHPEYTTIFIENHAHISALKATLTPVFGFSKVSNIEHQYRVKPFCQNNLNWSKCSKPVMVKKAFEINWHAAAFEPQAHVSIEAYKTFSEHGLCLTAPELITQDQPVTVKDCNHQNNQLWGLDKDQRYLSRQVDPVSPRDTFCLSAQASGEVVVQKCNASSQQKWRWEDDKLVNEVFSELTLTEGDQLTVRAQGKGDFQWRSYPRQINPEHLLRVHY